MRRVWFGAAGALVLLVMPAQAQDLNIPPVDYPALPSRGAAASAFVPSGWRLEQVVEGDLDKDERDDLLLLLRGGNPANIIIHDQMGESPFDTNPRILAVAFADGDSGYVLGLENHSLIARREDPVQSDPLSELGGIAIERGSIVVRLYLFMSAGGADMGTTAFRFRWQDGAFRLIGYDRSTTQRMSGDTEELSINFLTGKAVITTGNIERDDVETAERTPGRKPLLTLEQVGDGLMFDPAY